MHIITAKYLEKAALDLGLDCTIDENYSGRGMYNKTTVGVIISPEPLYQIIAYAAVLVTEDNDIEKSDNYYNNFFDIDTVIDEQYDSDKFIDDCGEFQKDTMGKSDIILY